VFVEVGALVGVIVLVEVDVGVAIGVNVLVSVNVPGGTRVGKNESIISV
jgi:hypothetical protein